MFSFSGREHYCMPVSSITLVLRSNYSIVLNRNVVGVRNIIAVRGVKTICGLNRQFSEKVCHIWLDNDQFVE